VQVDGDVHFIYHPGVAFQSPQNAALREVGREGFQFIPAVEAAVGIDGEGQ
jgi:hypothetical protein